MTRMSLAIALGTLLASPAFAAPVPDKVSDLVRALKNGKPGERVIAAETLGTLGPAAADAVPALVEVIRDTPIPDLSAANPPRAAQADGYLLDATWDALGRIGPKAVPALVALLAHKEDEIRGRAAIALKAIGPGAADAVPALAKLLREGENQWVCLQAIDALGAIGPKAEDTIPALVKMVLDPRPFIPGRLRKGQFAPEGPKWPLPLPLRAPAAKALAAVGPKALPAIRKEVIPAIAKALKDADASGTVFDGDSQSNGWPVWMAFGEEAIPLVPALAGCARRNVSGWHALTLLKLGPAGQKALAELLADKDEEFRTNLVGDLFLACRSRLPYDDRVDVAPVTPQLIPFLRHKDYEVRQQAMHIFFRTRNGVPPEAQKAALPLLDDVEYMKFQDENDKKRQSYRGEEVIAFCWPSAIPKLFEFLKSDDEQFREWATRSLEGMRGPYAADLLPILRDLAAGKTKNRVITAPRAAVMVAKITLDPKDIDALVPLLKSKDARARGVALSAFLELKVLSRPYLKHLLPLLKDDDDQNRELAAWAIDTIDSGDPDASAALARWVLEGRGGKWHLDGSGPLSKEFAPALPVVIGGLERGGVRDLYAACDMVSRIGPRAKDAVPQLIRLLRQLAETTRREELDLLERKDVLRALGAIGPDAKEAVPVILKQMAAASDWGKAEYLLCLADIGSGAKEAIPDLKELLVEPNPNIRLVAACALMKIENDPVTYRAVFIRGIREQSNWVRGPVPLVFARVAATYPELVPVAMRGCFTYPHTSSGDRNAALHALVRNAPALKPAIPELLKHVANPPPWGGRVEFVQMLGALGPDAKEALPVLRKLLNDPYFEMALAAREAIDKIEAKK